ncbi:DUF4318 domain-containing protein [Clostridium sp.]|uniref:DUF4318 domain-containing protein n=1 Tax=Clostridium sp. TaxID=1506 RepID=UPI003F3027FC
MMGKFIDSLIKKTIIIPYENSLVYPKTSITKEAIARYCAKESFYYEFLGKSQDDNLLVKINEVDYEVLRFFAGRGGYAIHCKRI